MMVSTALPPYMRQNHVMKKKFVVPTLAACLFFLVFVINCYTSLARSDTCIRDRHLNLQRGNQWNARKRRVKPLDNSCAFFISARGRHTIQPCIRRDKLLVENATLVSRSREAVRSSDILGSEKWAQTNGSTRLVSPCTDDEILVAKSTSEHAAVDSTRVSKASTQGTIPLLFPEDSNKEVLHSGVDNPECTGPAFSSFKEVMGHTHMHNAYTCCLDEISKSYSERGSAGLLSSI